MKASAKNPYPRTYEEFLDWFRTEQDCIEYLEWIRWGKGFVCPRCSGVDAWRLSGKGLFQCKSCGRQTSATSGTVFADGRKPLRLWFHVMWLLMAQKTGMSAKNFHDAFGFGSYQTSWGWLQKLRSVMIRPGRDKLSGRVEVDETYVGGQKEGATGRGAFGKTLVLVAVEVERRNKPGRTRFRVVRSADRPTILQFVRDYVETGSTVVTDGYYPYTVLDGQGFAHEKHVLNPSRKRKPSEGDVPEQNPEGNLEHVHMVVSLLKRWLAGTLQGAATDNHLPTYLDEFAFRFNRRKSTYRGMLFYRLVQCAVTTRPKSIKEFYVPKI